eukprot:3475791-Rhodomonas_salina.1
MEEASKEMIEVGGDPLLHMQAQQVPPPPSPYPISLDSTGPILHPYLPTLSPYVLPTLSPCVLPTLSPCPISATAIRRPSPTSRSSRPDSPYPPTPPLSFLRYCHTLPARYWPTAYRRGRWN